MADGDLFQADFDLAFAFARSEAADHRNAAGATVAAPIDTPRFDHDEDGAPRGLLIAPGSDIGRQDRVSIDPLILPEALLEGEGWTDRDCTVFHAHAPAVADDAEWAIVRRAWYSRDAKRAIDALLRQPGHHLDVGVISGFRPNLGGFVRLRGEVWLLTGLLFAGPGGLGAALTDGHGRPLVTGGAERFG